MTLTEIANALEQAIDRPTPKPCKPLKTPASYADLIKNHNWDAMDKVKAKSYREDMLSVLPELERKLPGLLHLPVCQNLDRRVCELKTKIEGWLWPSWGCDFEADVVYVVDILRQAERGPKSKMTIELILKYFDVSKATIWRAIKDGRLTKYQQPGGKVMVDSVEVAAFCERNK